ncbi:ADP-ribosylation factor-binding protein Gga [Arctopsyche grandis]|uniref:ADP-ribosylation factor-binding protein Gga n=1 Tax=Arctopsyche grandis TaxID=121162 RepID=UPI00406D6847
MEVVLTSLDALLHKATSANLERPDPAALEAFCAILADSPNGAYIATRVIASRIRSPHPTEALLALEVLDACMKRCDSAFHAEVDKFRFLNEMIKLVSPKYYGNKTAPAVRQKVLSLMHSWTVDYPREIKIKDAYEMLKKQGVVKETPPIPPPEDSPATVPKTRTKESIFEDEERSKMLQKLLQSKNPDDLQAANRLIKTMVREGERKIEAVTRQVTELQTVHNNVRLLDEMLEQYRPSVSSPEDLELIKELHSECTRLRPTVFKIAAEIQQNEDMLNEVLEVSDDLSKVLDKYTFTILHGKALERTSKQKKPAVINGDGDSLLDLATPSNSAVNNGDQEINKKSNLEELGDIFSTVDNSKKLCNALEVNSVPTLQPISLITSDKDNGTNAKINTQSVNKGMEELNALGEGLLKSSLPPSCKPVLNFNNQRSDKVPMNLMGKSQPSQESDASVYAVQKNPTDLLDLDFLISKTLHTEKKLAPQNLSSDDIMVDISSDDTLIDPKGKSNGDDLDMSLLDCLKSLNVNEEPSSSKKQTPNEAAPKPADPPVPKPPESTEVQSRVSEVKSLNDINIGLESIKASDVSPLVAFEESDGITVVLHFARNKPRPDVFVIVVSSTSRNPHPIVEYKFHAVVPKGCKIRQLPQSGDNFPAFTPFLPPAAVTQILLIAHPIVENPLPVFLKFVVSYVCQEDSISEMGEINELPLNDI